MLALFACWDIIAPPIKAAPPHKVGRWRKLGPDDVLRVGDFYATMSPARLASMLANPALFTAITAPVMVPVFAGKEIGQKVKNCLVLDPAAGFWRFEDAPEEPQTSMLRWVKLEGENLRRGDFWCERDPNRFEANPPLMAYVHQSNFGKPAAEVPTMSGAFWRPTGPA
jgi:hypothetical protein